MASAINEVADQGLHYRLDDVLSAVDSDTAQHLLRNALTGTLAKDRLLLMATHATSLAFSHATAHYSIQEGTLVQVGSCDPLTTPSKKSEALPSYDKLDVPSDSQDLKAATSEGLLHSKCPALKADGCNSQT